MVDPVRGLDIKQIPVDHRGAIGRVAGKHPQLVKQIVFPEHARLPGFRPRGLALHIQAQHLEAVRNEIDLVPIYHRRRTNSERRWIGADADEPPVNMVRHLAGRSLPTPEPLAGLFLQAQQQSSPWVFAPEEDLAVGHHRRRVNGLAELVSPAHVPGRLQLDLAHHGILLSRDKRIGQPLLF